MLPAGYHGHDRWLLLLAALIGLVGGLATVAFHEGMAFTESIATGHPGSLVSASESLAPWRRAITRLPSLPPPAPTIWSMIFPTRHPCSRCGADASLQDWIRAVSVPISAGTTLG